MKKGSIESGNWLNSNFKFLAFLFIHLETIKSFHLTFLYSNGAFWNKKTSCCDGTCVKKVIQPFLAQYNFSTLSLHLSLLPLSYIKPFLWGVTLFLWKLPSQPTQVEKQKREQILSIPDSIWNRNSKCKDVLKPFVLNFIKRLFYAIKTVWVWATFPGLPPLGYLPRLPPPGYLPWATSPCYLPRAIPRG